MPSCPSLSVRSTFRATGVMLALVLAACSDTTKSSDPGDDNSVQLTTVANDVILATYVDLDAKAALLQTAVATLNTDPTGPNLAAAQQAWRDARRPWEQSEAFLFGPVETQGIDPSIDSWPVNKADLDEVLAGSDALTSDFIDGLEGTLKGFHTIEYLLFGVDDSQTAADLTAREREYLVGVTGSFRTAVSSLKDAWAPTGGNFVAVLETAGTGTSIYVSQSAALQELVNGMIAICEEVANGKIADPFNQQDRSLEESQFSNNSNSDFADNIRSAKNVYLGTLNGSAGQGLTAIVAEKDPAVDTDVKAELDAAITAIGQMTPTFGEAIFTNQSAVTAAQTAVQTLMNTLQGEVLPLVTGS